MDTNGYMRTGWTNIDNIWYYFHSDGSMATGWIMVNGIWYYLKPDGSRATGWIVDGNKWYCLAPTGAMYASTVTPDGYTVDASGAWIVNGEVQIQQ